MGLYAIALAIVVVGLVWVGVPASTLLIAAAVLVCPVMMFLMMRGMHDGDMSGRDTMRQDHHHHASEGDAEDMPGAGPR